jgi:Rab GDP dissociation inhibitor
MADDNEMKEFDVIVLGTGLKECILSGLLSASGKRVLHIDRNSYYGGESASVNLTTLFEKFKDGATAPAELGRAFDYCVDLAPKFLMASGDLVKILIQTDVTQYLEFVTITGSYVFNSKKIYKVPSSGKEALGSSLLGLMDKNRFRQFLTYVAQYEVDDKSTHKHGYDLNKMTASELYGKFSLGSSVQNFTGHAVALYLDDDYLSKPALDLVLRCQLYANSVARYGTGSPYIYPKYGLGNIPEGFSRRCAVHGGIFMLNTCKAEPFVEEILYGADGKVAGIRLGEDVIKNYDLPSAVINCKQLVADPSYFLGTDKVKKTGEIARCIALLDHPIPNTNNADSCQIIIPASQVGRKSDVYVCMTSESQKICPKGKFMAVLSASRENPKPEDDLKPALDLLGPTVEQFVWNTESYEPTSDGSATNCFITTAVDATTHFTTSSAEVVSMFKTITGTELDLDAPSPSAAAGEAAEE